MTGSQHFLRGNFIIFIKFLSNVFYAWRSQRYGIRQCMSKSHRSTVLEFFKIMPESSLHGRTYEEELRKTKWTVNVWVEAGSSRATGQLPLSSWTWQRLVSRGRGSDVYWDACVCVLLFKIISQYKVSLGS